MKRLLVFSLTAVLFAGVCLFRPVSSFSKDNDVQELKKQIEALQKRVQELESTQNKDDDSQMNPLLPRRHAWDPFEEMARMQEEIDRMFQGSFSLGGHLGRGMFQNNMFYNDDFEIKEEKDKYIIEFDMAGLQQDNIDIQLNENSITIKGEMQQEETQEDDNKYFSSKSQSSFIKTIPVPEGADTRNMKSEMKGDKLIITLSKKKS